MKRILLTMMALVIVVMTNAQTEQDQGVVEYEEVMKMDIQLDDLPAEMQANIPKETRSKMALHFNKDASLYQVAKNDSETAFDEEVNGGMMKVMISQPQNIVYRDLKNKMITQQKEFMSRIFLIESDPPKNEWKLSGKQKMILGYPCQEATLYRGDSLIRVWFTPAIPISTGPSRFGNLPGLILAVEEQNGDRMIIATSIKLEEIDPEQIQKPKKGKKVSQKKYASIVEEKMKEMGAEQGGGKSMIITIKQ